MNFAISKPGIATLAVFALAAWAGPASADQIIGYWCSPSGSQSIKVDHSSVVSPGGRTVEAQVRRHYLEFVIPQGEANAGAKFTADQLGEERISVKIISKGGTSTPEIWVPCKPIS